MKRTYNINEIRFPKINFGLFAVNKSNNAWVYRINIFIVSIALSSGLSAQPDAISVNPGGDGTVFEMTVFSGKAHNHPSFAIWLEDVDGNYVQTLYVTQSVGTGIYPYKPSGKLKWEKGPGEGIRPASLPYWFHKRNVNEPGKAVLPSSANPVPDAYTGATPKSDFSLELHADKRLTGKIRILMEVNQPWDVNEFWTNGKYADNPEYLTSCQPALVYAVTVDMDKPMDSYYLNPIGHSHPYGADGLLYTNLTTITTALDIFREIRVVVSRR